VTITSAAEASGNAVQTITGTATSPDTTVAGQTVTLTDNGNRWARSGSIKWHLLYVGDFAEPGANSIVASITDSLGLTGSSSALVDTLDSIAPTLAIANAPIPNDTAAQSVSGSVVSGARRR